MNVNTPSGGGRHHWSRVYSAALVGGGAARGKVVGSSDRIGGDVRDTPVSPKDLLATSLHLLGIDPQMLMHDAEGRPQHLVSDGRVRNEFFYGRVCAAVVQGLFFPAFAGPDCLGEGQLLIFGGADLPQPSAAIFGRPAPPL